MSVSSAKILKTEPLSNGEAVWTKMVLKTYRDPLGTIRTWESAERTTRPKNSDIDGVGIVAILEKETGPEIILQKQYRPSVEAVCIEIPAGLIDEGETAEQCAVRELREETGYVGQASKTTPIMFNDPGFCNTNLRMVHVTIDMSLPENQNLKPELEENEFIEVFHVPLKDLWTKLVELEGEGCAIDARIATLAEGIELAKQFRL
ncbi:hypothetical protein DL546_004999 [Coniochaeta pulveracea]|uniref:Nudix hydrolase domain-containing protein n=1 Tax=Coniochaeta pulveracea TaxID=177199 RepID=A0A420Y8T3_9PEZI|nr:hypothetical protein DL546_004999 [Coniochaeta pulveracea]